MRGIIRPIISVTLIVLSVLGLINVYSDNSEVVREASRLACSGCEARLVQSGRSPVSQALTFQTGPGSLVTVECRRGLIFLGEYKCELMSSPTR
jgi:hypothetical protein